MLHTHTHTIIPKYFLNCLEEAERFVGIENIKKVEWKKLEDFSTYSDGTHKTPDYKSNGVPFVSVENIKNIYESKKYISYEDFNKYKMKPQKDDLFMTRIGDIGTCFVIDRDTPLAYYVTLSLIRTDKKVVLSKFLKYLIESSYGKKELNKRILHNANPIKINLKEIGKLQFPIPPLEVQEHIVSILDKLDTLVNSLKEGLPKEIELRQKQYEYYREKLLDFKK